MAILRREAQRGHQRAFLLPNSKTDDPAAQHPVSKHGVSNSRRHFWRIGKGKTLLLLGNGVQHLGFLQNQDTGRRKGYAESTSNRNTEVLFDTRFLNPRSKRTRCPRNYRGERWREKSEETRPRKDACVLDSVRWHSSHLPRRV